MTDKKKTIKIVDTTLRDGSHSVRDQFTLEDITVISPALDESGVYATKISHGDGLAGSSIQYGWSLFSEEERLTAANQVIKKNKLAVPLLPGIGTRKDLQKAIACGTKMARIATHVTEANICEQHIKMCKDMGLEVVTFLMLAHMEPPVKVLEQAKLIGSQGADVVYVVDSAGAMLPADVRARVSILKEHLKVEVGFHAHNNLGLGIGNTLVPIEEGTTAVDGSLCGMGGGSGNAATEVLVAVLERAGYDTGVNLYKMMDAAEEIVRPRMPRPQTIGRSSLSLGYAGVYSSFLLHTYKAAERFKADPLDVLIELGKWRVVGGQEDMIVDVAYELAQAQSKGR